MKLRRFLLPVGVLAGFVLVGVLVIRTAPEPQPTPREELGALVEVTPIERGLHRLDVDAQGVVLPAKQVNVQPQVAGRIEWIAPGFVPGGRFGRGAPLFRIEADDFELAVETARSSLQEAEAQLELERGRGRVAEREWELFRDEVDEQQREGSLALREPQLRSAEAAVAAAKARLARAELDLERTVVRAPWNAMVLDESIEVGQTVGVQSQVATLVGTDEFWVRASVPTDSLGEIALPGRDARASRAWIELDTGDDQKVSRIGTVTRLLGDVDTAGRMARVVIEVPDPLASSDAGDRLLLDAYVDVRIEGAEERALFELPRSWVRDGNTVWLFDDGRLEMREVEVVWRGVEVAYVDQGLEPGDLVVTSSIATPIPGMKLRRIASADEAPSREGVPLRLPTEETLEDPMVDPVPPESLDEDGGSAVEEVTA